MVGLPEYTKISGYLIDQVPLWVVSVAYNAPFRENAPVYLPYTHKGDGTVRKKKLSADKVRVTLDLSPEFYQQLENLEQRVGADSKAAVLRDALRLYSYIVDRHIEGDKFLVRNEKGQDENIVLLGAVSLAL